MRRRALLSAALLSLASACGAGEILDCFEDRCDAVESRDELLAEIADHVDPIADYLRGAVLDSGRLAGDYRDVLGGVGEILGCPPSSERSFVVLSNEAFIPKPLLVSCASDPQAASRFFMAVPALDARGDVEPGLLHLAAWDESAGRYRHYSTFPGDGGEMQVAVQPGF